VMRSCKRRYRYSETPNT